ncbi:MAG: hypothetical protein ACOC5R_01510 [Elusimicrobiota bacterium]
MMKKISIAIILVIAMMTVSNGITAGTGKKLAVGINYPGLGVRYGITDSVCMELKGQYQDDIIVAGLRSYKYFSSLSGVHPFVGIEADFVDFKGDQSEGSGIALEIYGGGEYFLTKNLSFQLDIGPAYIALSDKNYDVSEDGIEFIANMGINWYFSK